MQGPAILKFYYTEPTSTQITLEPSLTAFHRFYAEKTVVYYKNMWNSGAWQYPVVMSLIN